MVVEVNGGISSQNKDCMELLGPWTCRRYLDVKKVMRLQFSEETVRLSVTCNHTRGGAVLIKSKMRIISPSV